jgi:predicted metal-binding membrane protein
MDTARDLARVRNPVLLISAATWILLSVLMVAHSPSTGARAVPPAVSFHMLLAMSPIPSLAAGWALMLAAMMSPVLIAPVYHIRLRSFTHRRARSVTLFVVGYAVIWMALGVAVLALEPAVTLFAPQSYLPATAAVLIALVWQVSPIKQRCLNRCHARPGLAAFGAAADFDALRFGITHGMWCVGSCWGLMLFPLLLPRAHVVAMAAVAVLIFSERLERPMPPSWRWRGLGRVSRMLVTQSRIGLRAHADA